MTSYGAFYSTDRKTHSIQPPQHPPISGLDSAQKCPMSFAHKSLGQRLETSHEYRPPQKGDTRSVCPALNTMANHGYIPRDGRNLTFFTLFYGLKACYGLSTPLTIVLVLGGFYLIKRFPICLPFNVPEFLQATNPDGSKSQPGVIDLRLVGLHGGVEHDASLVHEDCPDGSRYPNCAVRQDMVGNLVGDVLPKVKGYGRSASCSSHRIEDLKEKDGNVSFSSPSILTRLRSFDSHHRRQNSDASSSSETAVSDDEGEHDDEEWRQYATKEYLGTLVSAADVGRMRARRQREIAPKILDKIHAEIARGEMGIILGVWERSVKIKEDGKVITKKGIPLPYLLTWLAEERLPEGWKPTRVMTLRGVRQNNKVMKAVAEAVEKSNSY